ncbi:MAG: cation:proton antiporter [Candidatus Scalindua sp.]|nr:cation:proton antiporter [Candidatus Scalindua sp.]MDV5167082.1 cation:proton antiporter [Candidatus Scalindua sp.]
MGLSITSIAVQARILHDMNIHNTKIGHIIIGAAIIDDILALVTLSILLGLAESGKIQAMQISFVVFKAIAFFAITILIGQFIIPKLIRKLDDREAKTFTFALISALVVGYLAELAGLHLIIGAFLAGQFVRKEIIDRGGYKKINDRFYSLSYGFMAPVFFVSLSFHLHFQWKWPIIIFILTITLIAIAGKLIGCGVGAFLYGNKFWGSAIIGCGMNGRGAVEMVIAAVVIKLSDKLTASNSITEPLLTQDQFSALICMAFITTIIAPLTLKWTAKKYCIYDENAQFCGIWDKSKKGQRPVAYYRL